MRQSWDHLIYIIESLCRQGDIFILRPPPCFHWWPWYWPFKITSITFYSESFWSLAQCQSCISLFCLSVTSNLTQLWLKFLKNPIMQHSYLFFHWITRFEGGGGQQPIYSISQEICTRFLLCCALLWLYIDWFSHIHQAYFTGTVAI